jgi:hypothetical protein
VPEIVGALVFAGAAGAAVTTPVCDEDALLEPAPFEAVTATRTVPPTSPVTSVYAFEVAPAMSAQPAPLLSQRRH